MISDLRFKSCDPSGPIKTYTKKIPITDALYKQVGLKISENNFELCLEDSFMIFKSVDLEVRFL